MWSMFLAYGHAVHLRNLMRGIIAIFAFVIWGVAANADPIRVVMLGDSLTAGYGLPVGQGLVPQLQNWLDARDANVQLANAGVSGDTTAGGRARLDWTLADQPDALIVELGANDVLRAIDPAHTRSNLSAILATANDLGLPTLLIGIQAPGNYGSDFKAAFDAIYPELAQEFGALLMPSFFAPLIDENSQAINTQYLQPDGLHPNPAGVDVLTEAVGPYILMLVEELP